MKIILYLSICEDNNCHIRISHHSATLLRATLSRSSHPPLGRIQ